MINRERAWEFAHEWLDAWNKHDVDLIMKHYANSIEFCSPIVQKVLGVLIRFFDVIFAFHIYN